MLVLALLTAFFMSPANGKKGNLLLEVRGITEITGDLQIGIYNTAEGFSHKETIYIGKIITVKGSTMVVEIPDLPHGTYAIAAYHDKNRNGKLDKGFFGIPTENYGFSNNARGTFGPPDFNDAKFEFNASTGKISMELR
jgi:uncharacterized protein (DUF2141 family)